MSAMERIQSVTVASGATVSSVIMASGFARFGLSLPSAFTGTSVTFEATTDINGAAGFQALCSSATTAVSLTVAANRAYDLPDSLRAWPAWRIVTGTAQSTNVTLTVAMLST